MIPDKVWEAVLAGGGLGGAVALCISFVAISAIGLLWKAYRDTQAATLLARQQWAEELKACYDARIQTMEDLLTKVNSIVERNTITLADNTRVVEARAEAIRQMAEMLTKLVTTYEARGVHFTAQMERMENGMGRIIDMVRPPTPRR